MTTKEDTRQVFFEQKEDARAICFAGLSLNSCEPEWDLVRRAALAGDAFAQAQMAVAFFPGESMVLWAERAAAQNERDGFHWLGRCFLYGEGCVIDKFKARELFPAAADLGHVVAMCDYGTLLCNSDPLRCMAGESSSMGQIS